MGNYLVVSPSLEALGVRPVRDAHARRAPDAGRGHRGQGRTRRARRPRSDSSRSSGIAWKQDREAEDVAMRTKHGGSAPDFGDPAQALADIDSKAAKFFGMLGDLDEARLALQHRAEGPR